MADPAPSKGNNETTDPDVGSVVLSAEGCSAGFEAERNRFVADAADRLVNMRAFTPLTCGYWVLTAADRAALARRIVLAGVSEPEAAEMVAEFLRLVANRGAEFERAHAEDDAMQTVDVVRVLEDALANVLRSSRDSETSDPVRTRDAADVLVASAYGGVDARPVPAGEHETRETIRSTLGIEPGRTGTQLAIHDGLISFLDLGWLGILHYDRMRLRPSGLLAGEQVYSLALTPGEEVSYTQRSETRRSRSFEDVLTQSLERELEFSSTWTTTLSQQDVDTTGRTSGGNLSYGVPINIGGGMTTTVNSSTNSAKASSTSSTAQAARNQELTGHLTARARQEHKTTFRVSTETVDEFGSKRTVRNINPSHALTLNFYKLYQKYRVVLERYDAKLAFAFTVDDPGMELRAELEDELAKLDPQVPPDACPPVPQMQTAVLDHTFINSPGFKFSGQHIFPPSCQPTPCWPAGASSLSTPRSWIRGALRLRLPETNSHRSAPPGNSPPPATFRQWGPAASSDTS